MLLQAAPRHELVNEKSVFILVAVADQFDEVRMPQLPQKDDFSLHNHRAMYAFADLSVKSRHFFFSFDCF
jgi:prepilin-type processing-associated H-X9-DG protein